MGNRKWAAVAAVCLGLLVGGYFVFRWRENHGHHPAYGDVATWLTFAAAAVGIPFAVYQFNAQRKQLAEQQKTIKGEFTRQQKRDELLDAELAQAKAAHRVLIRAQAAQVDIRFERWEKGKTAVTLHHMVRVVNDSPRPIRNIQAWIQDRPDSPPQPAESTVMYSLALRGPAGRPEPGSVVELMRADTSFAFIFATKYDDAPEARMSVTFTDDAGSRWRIDHDLHLEQIE